MAVQVIWLSFSLQIVAPHGPNTVSYVLLSIILLLVFICSSWGIAGKWYSTPSVSPVLYRLGRISDNCFQALEPLPAAFYILYMSLLDALSFSHL